MFLQRARARNHKSGPALIMQEHKCGAPICSLDDQTEHGQEVLWYPGESICGAKPYSVIQENQIKLNVLFRANKLKGNPKKLPKDYTVDGTGFEPRAYTAAELKNSQMPELI